MMEKVAEHINEMQRIHEEYGAIFDHLFRQHQKACKQVDCSEVNTTAHSLFTSPVVLTPLLSSLVQNSPFTLQLTYVY